MIIGVLHPGEMGQSVCRALQDSGHDVVWCRAERSAATCHRGEPYRCVDSLAEMTAAAQGIISVCPPAESLVVARSVLALGYAGIFVDANAVAPATAQQLSQMFASRYVDGGIIGPPADQAGTTRLYLSGDQAQAVAAWFSAGDLDARVVGTEPAQASALKMAYAAYTKGSSALLLAVNALAGRAGVEDQLWAEWELSQPGLLRRSEGAAGATARKAWRFVGEMEEIASTFAAADLPAGFHRGALEIYARMAGFKDADGAISLADVMAALNRKPGQSSGG